MRKEIILEAANKFAEKTGLLGHEFLVDLEDIILTKDNLLEEVDLVKKEIYLEFFELKDVSELITNTDLFKDKETKLEDGSFYTPPVWVEETRDMIERNIPDYRDYVVWDASCGSGNLLEFFGDCKAVYGSTLDEVDVKIASERFPDYNIFQLDFLKGIDYSEFERGFLDRLPQGLQDVILNNEKLLIVMNPPYAVTNARHTDVAKFVKGTVHTQVGGDLLRQFIWRVLYTSDMFNLTNTEFCLIGTTSLLNRKNWDSTIHMIQEHGDFVEGFIYSAWEFPGISKSVTWGIFTMLINLHGYEDLRIEYDDFNFTLKSRDEETNVITDTGEVSFSWGKDRKLAKEWIQEDAKFRKELIPEAGVDGVIKRNEKGEPQTAWGTREALLYFLFRGNFRETANFNGVSTVPITNSVYTITEDNFDKMLILFPYTLALQVDLGLTLRHMCAPDNEGSDLYNQWVENTVLFLPCNRKSYFVPVEDVVTGVGYINNKISVLRPSDLEGLTDEKLLNDFNTRGYASHYYEGRVDKALEVADKPFVDLFNFVKGVLKETLNTRSEVDYEYALNFWDVTIYNIRRTDLWTEEWEKEYRRLNGLCIEWYRANLDQLGF